MSDTATASSAASHEGAAELIEQLLSAALSHGDHDSALVLEALASLVDGQLVILSTVAKLNALYEQLSPLADQLASGGLGGVFGILGGLARKDHR